MFSNSKMSEFDLRGVDQNLLKKTEIQKSLSYLVSGQLSTDKDNMKFGHMLIILFGLEL